ncbi:MAG: sensor histidine kinase [Candidatus Zixiibacteriota bacterium]
MALFKRKESRSDRFQITYKGIPAVYKIALAVFILLVIGLFFLYSEYIRQAVIENNRRIIKAHARLYAIAKSEAMSGPALGIIFEEVIEKSDFPMILTNSDKQPLSWRNVNISESDTTEKARQELIKMIHEMEQIVKPVEINVGRSNQILGYIYFGEPSYIKWVRVIPALELFFITVLLIFGFSVYNSIRNFEKQNIWLGLAREMAHQLGTPISSLMGWIEILRDRLPDTKSQEDEFFYEIVEEMDLDIQVLSRIVVRFGQIGSLPELKPTHVDKVVTDVVQYLKERIPKLREKVSLTTQIEKVPTVLANELLLSWACENIIKNAVDAFGRKNGHIQVSVRTNVENTSVQIIFTDDGKGISLADQRKIFSPGFTTKKRGWGLGLSLTRRIAEEYHYGRLYLLESHPYEKTTFVLEIPIEK